MKKKHAGWGMTMGRPICGAAGKYGTRTTMSEDDVTCLGCLRKLVRDANREVQLHESRWEAAQVGLEKAVARLERQMENKT